MNRRELLAAALAAPVAAKVTRAAAPVALNLGAAARHFEVGGGELWTLDGWIPLAPVWRVTAVDHVRGVVTFSCDD